MSVDESKMAVDQKAAHNLKIKLLFKVENTKPLSLSKTLLTIDQIQIVKDLTATDQVQIAPYTLSRSPNSDRQTIRLHKPTTDTHTRQNCPRN